MIVQAKIPPRYMPDMPALPRPGETAEDGTIYLGCHGDQDWYAMDDFARDRKGIRLKMDFDAAAAYAKNLIAHGYNDWIIPPCERGRDGLNILHAMTEHLTENGQEENAYACWSSTRAEGWKRAFLQKIERASPCLTMQTESYANVRCVRAVLRNPAA